MTEMIELVNLEDCVGYVVKVLRRDDRILYGKIENRLVEYPADVDYRPFVFNLGSAGICYSKYGRILKEADGHDIIWIKKIAKDT
jgi:hypothetical protein